jgi:hypothetical protein
VDGRLKMVLKCGPFKKKVKININEQKVMLYSGVKNKQMPLKYIGK